MASLLKFAILLLQIVYSLGIGLEQTPIDITSCYKKCLDPLLFFNYNTLISSAGGSFKLKNTNYGLLTYTGSPTPYIVGGPLAGRGSYLFHSMHVHWSASDYGGEHTIRHKQAGAEMHFVHYKSAYSTLDNALNFKDGLAVVGIVFTITEFDNPDLNIFLQAHSSIVNYGAEYTFTSNPLSWIGKYFIDNPGFITYNGSLTTYSFNEVVTWILLYKTSTISRNQLNQLRAIKDNTGKFVYEFSRSTQTVNNRRIICHYCRRNHYHSHWRNMPFDIEMLDEETIK